VEAIRAAIGRTVRYEIEIAAGRGAPASARAAIQGLGLSLLDGRTEDARLAISEVVANAVLHGRLQPDIDTVRVLVDADDDSVRVDVEQPTPAEGVAISEPRLDDPNDAGGFGLRLLDHVVDRWGHQPGPPGRVWFEFHQPEANATAD